MMLIDNSRHNLYLALLTAHISKGVKLKRRYLRVLLVGDSSVFIIYSC